MRTLPNLVSNAHPLDASPEAIGELSESNSIVADASALRERMNRDGYLLLRGLLDREQVLAACRSAAEELLAKGYLQAGTDPMYCVAARDGARECSTISEGPTVRCTEFYMTAR